MRTSTSFPFTIPLWFFINSILYLELHGKPPDLLYTSHDICEESKFYRPYIKIFASRFYHYIGYSPVAQMKGTGFKDLRKHSGILCINGPAFLYLELVPVLDAASSTAILSVVFGGTTKPKVYQHECFSLNRLPRDAYKTGNIWVTTETKVFGNKIYGVYLLGREGNYLQSDFVFFNEPDFGYARDREILDGASIAFIISSRETSAFCYHVDALNVDGVITGKFQDEESMFCYHTDHKKGFDLVWHQNVMVNEVKWGSCGDGVFTPVKYAQSLEQLERDDKADFTLAIPNLLTNFSESGAMWWKLGYFSKFKSLSENKQNLSGTPAPGLSLLSPECCDNDDLFRAEDVETSTSNVIPPTLEYRRYTLDLMSKDCIPIPKLEQARVGVCHLNGTNGCSILNHILTIEETNWKVGKLLGGNWRKPIILLIQKIYTKVCPQVGKIFVPAVTRIFEYYLSTQIDTSSVAEGKFSASRRGDWVGIQLDLERCNKYAKALPFTWSPDQERVARQRFLQSEFSRLTSFSRKGNVGEDSGILETTEIIQGILEEVNGIELRYPYKVVGNDYKGMHFELNHQNSYIEGAEIDYNLDWAIDSFWKIISTVIGYCYVHYDIQDPGTFIKVYDFFADDFLDYVKEIWVQGQSITVYDHLLAKFVRGPGSIWIDAYNNGAYHWANIPQLRPLRPIFLTHGEDNSDGMWGITKNSTFTFIPNFFIVNPNF